mmetsp:Transcript_1628/g.7093  ORF Transcript_1628/g.7093 Transcript_1628/m.7093 type:complete len:284 (+) Transcript_1628:5532-6383(+)
MGSTCDVAVAVVVEKNVADLIVRGKTNADAQAERLGGIVKRQPCSPRSEGLASVGGRDLRIVHAREQGILHFLLILHSFVLFTPVDLMLLALRALRVVDGIGEVDLPLDVAVLEQANLGMHFVLRAPVGFAVVAVLVCGIQRGALEHQLLFVLVVTVLLVADTVVAHVITEVLVVVRIALSQDHVPTVVVLEARVLLDADLDHFAIGRVYEVRRILSFHDILPLHVHALVSHGEPFIEHAIFMQLLLLLLPLRCPLHHGRLRRPVPSARGSLRRRAVSSRAAR